MMQNDHFDIPQHKRDSQAEDLSARQHAADILQQTGGIIPVFGVGTRRPSSRGKHPAARWLFPAVLLLLLALVSGGCVGYFRRVASHPSPTVSSGKTIATEATRWIDF
jgi:multisubunit Na+/H+ antiporter MnhG subunit